MYENEAMTDDELKDWLMERPKYIKILRILCKYQGENEASWKEGDGIESRKIIPLGVSPMDLYHLYRTGLLAKVYDSNKYKEYRIIHIPYVEKIIKEIEETESQEQHQESEPDIIPDDIFDCVIGHEGKKRRIMRALRSHEPVALLLVGEPGTAKSLITDSIGDLPHTSLAYGTGASRSGLTDLLFNARPRRLIYEEIDKAAPKDYSVLLELTERGTVTETKVRKTRSMELRCMVITTANELSKVPKEYIDRFDLIYFKTYTQKEFYDTVVSVLASRYSLDSVMAEHVAQVVWIEMRCKSVRQAIRIAQMCKTVEEVNEYLEDWKEGRS